MDKSEKKVFTIIIFIVMVFSVCITVLSLFKIPMISNDNSAKISIGEARSEVLVFTEQEADIKNGFRYYDFSFNDGTMSYKYRIDAHTGDVVLSSSEQID